MSVLTQVLSDLGLALQSEEVVNNFILLFQKWNQSINLSAARSQSEILEHIVDSLHVIPHLRATLDGNSAAAHVLDVGSGGGLPAAIVAICAPEIHVTALEPVHKKHAFLRTVARQLSLANFEPLAERLDDHAHRDYDIAMSRATFDLQEWLLRGLSHVRTGGVVLGFEAVLRTDLPAGCRRYPYALNGKPRAIIALQRAAGHP
jgi:16S rRNA (guanine527-N7)-methyltransferase